MRDIKWLSDMKIRLGWGMTGQQEINQEIIHISQYNENELWEWLLWAVGNGNLARQRHTNPDLKWGNNNNTTQVLTGAYSIKGLLVLSTGTIVIQQTLSTWLCFCWFKLP